MSKDSYPYAHSFREVTTFAWGDDSPVATAAREIQSNFLPLGLGYRESHNIHRQTRNETLTEKATDKKYIFQVLSVSLTTDLTGRPSLELPGRVVYWNGKWIDLYYGQELSSKELALWQKLFPDFRATFESFYKDYQVQGVEASDISIEYLKWLLQHGYGVVADDGKFGEEGIGALLASKGMFCVPSKEYKRLMKAYLPEVKIKIARKKAKKA